MRTRLCKRLQKAPASLGMIATRGATPVKLLSSKQNVSLGRIVLKRCLLVTSFYILLFCIGQLTALHAAADDGSILQRVQKRGFLVCGTGDKEPGFSIQSESGWQGIYIDLCRALAAATLQNGKAVRFRPLAGASRFAAVARGEVDVLARGTALAFSSDTSDGTAFVAPFFYDGTGFLIRKSRQIASALELSGAQICVVTGSLAHVSADRFFMARDMNVAVNGSETWSGAVSQFVANECSVLIADVARLAIERSQLVKPEQYTLLPEIASAEMFGPVVSSDDWKWFKIVRWVIYALIKAEELGVSKNNIQNLAEKGAKAQQNFLMAAALSTDELGLPPVWLIHTLASVGNYGEIYERNLGKKSGFNVPRKLNELVKNSGVMMAPAFR